MYFLGAQITGICYTLNDDLNLIKINYLFMNFKDL